MDLNIALSEYKTAVELKALKLKLNLLQNGYSENQVNSIVNLLLLNK